MKKFASLRGKRIVVTGANGFIGSHLVEKLLEEGTIVTALVHYNGRQNIGNLDFIKNIRNSKSCRIIFGDITDPYFCLDLLKNQDLCIHLATLIDVAYSYEVPKQYFAINTIGTINLLDAAVRQKLKRFVHVSSSEVYGDPQIIPMNEEHRLYARSPYAASKIAADQAVLSYGASYNLPYTIIRPFNTFGPRQSTRAVIPNILTQLLSSQKKIISVGALDISRDFTYISDTITGFLQIIDNDKSINQVINVGSNHKYSIREIYDIASRIRKLKKPLHINKKYTRPATSEIMQQQCDNSKLQKMCAWKPNVPFEIGIEKTIQWIEAHLDTYTDEMATKS